MDPIGSVLGPMGRGSVEQISCVQLSKLRGQGAYTITPATKVKMPVVPQKDCTVPGGRRPKEWRLEPELLAL